jgi:hypothetical protein
MKVNIDLFAYLGVHHSLLPSNSSGFEEVMTSFAGVNWLMFPLETITIREGVEDFLPAATSLGMRSNKSNDVAKKLTDGRKRQHEIPEYAHW